MVISIQADKVFDKNPTPFSNKNTQQTRSRKEYPQPHKGHLQKLITNTLNGYQLDTFP